MIGAAAIDRDRDGEPRAGVAGALDFLGEVRVDWEQVPTLLLTATLYGGLLGLAVVPVVSILVGKITPEAVL